MTLVRRCNLIAFRYGIVKQIIRLRLGMHFLSRARQAWCLRLRYSSAVARQGGEVRAEVRIAVRGKASAPTDQRMGSGSSQNRGPESVPTDRPDGEPKTPYSEDAQNEKNENCEKGEKLFSNCSILIRLQTVLKISKVLLWAKVGQNAPLPKRTLRAPPGHY